MATQKWAAVETKRPSANKIFMSYNLYEFVDGLIRKSASMPPIGHDDRSFFNSMRNIDFIKLFCPQSYLYTVGKPIRAHSILRNQTQVGSFNVNSTHWAEPTCSKTHWFPFLLHCSSSSLSSQSVTPSQM